MSASLMKRKTTHGALGRAEFRRVREMLGRYPVRFAYLFGSRTTGRARPQSDVDVAVFLSSRMTASGREKARLALTLDLCRALRTDEVDLVVLNDAPPYLAFQVTGSRRVLYSRDETARIRFEARSMSLYYDRRSADLRSADGMLARVAARGLAA